MSNTEEKHHKLWLDAPKRNKKNMPKDIYNKLKSLQKTKKEFVK